MNARIYAEGVPERLDFDCSPSTPAWADLWNLVPAAGRLDLAFLSAGTNGLDDRISSAVRCTVYGTELRVANWRTSCAR